MRIDRVWAMPNKHTFTILPIKELVEGTIKTTGGYWADPFSGGSRLCGITNDLNPDVDADYHEKAKDFLARLHDGRYDGLIIDPPYSPHQVKQVYKGYGLQPTQQETASSFYGNLKDEAQCILNVGGVVIWCGWNSNGVGKSRGFEMERILLVGHGGSHQDTIVTVERKVR